MLILLQINSIHFQYLKGGSTVRITELQFMQDGIRVNKSLSEMVIVLLGFMTTKSELG